MKQSETGELIFDSFDESSLYFAKLLMNSRHVHSTNSLNANTYKSDIVELRNVSYSIPAGKVLSDNPYHQPTPFWAISESLSEILNLTRPIMERYSPDIMDSSYYIFADRQPIYSYGERLHMFNQIMNVFNKLNDNLQSKRAYLSVYQGFDTDISRKDVPCTIGWNLSARNDRLSISTHLRSWDFFAGNIYDTFLANILLQSFTSWLSKSRQTSITSGRLHFYADSLHYYPGTSQQKLDQMIKFGETNFYDNLQSFTFNVDVIQYYKDMYHLSDAEQASYNGNFDYSLNKLRKITDCVIQDFARMYIIKNARKNKDNSLVSRMEHEIEAPDLRKWFVQRNKIKEL